MTQNTRIIRIAIREPEPGWWRKVKAEARRQGIFVSALVVAATNRYLRDSSQKGRRPDR